MGTAWPWHEYERQMTLCKTLEWTGTEGTDKQRNYGVPSEFRFRSTSLHVNALRLVWDVETCRCRKAASRRNDT